MVDFGNKVRFGMTFINRRGRHGRVVIAQILQCRTPSVLCFPMKHDPENPRLPALAAGLPDHPVFETDAETEACSRSVSSGQKMGTVYIFVPGPAGFSPSGAAKIYTVPISRPHFPHGQCGHR